MKKIFIALSLSICVACTAGAQNIYTFAGTGTAGYTGDGVAATASELNTPICVTIAGGNEVYIADGSNFRIRKVSSSGIISTYAGDGTSGFFGDGGAATAAKFAEPFDIVFDSFGNLFVADRANHRVRKISASGIITTVAGDGTAASGGDGLAATAAQIYSPSGLAFDGGGNLYIAETNGQRIRKVSTAGIITTVAGTGTAGFFGDGGAATAAQINGPLGIAVDAPGNLYIGDVFNHRVRKVSPSGTITTIAGTGTAGSAGDGSAATAAQLNNPGGLSFDFAGNLYIGDGLGCRVRKINTSGIISTLAGTGTCGYSGDGSPATAAELNRPRTVAFDVYGAIYIADFLNNRVRKIPGSTTGITEVAGNEPTLFPNPVHEELTIAADPLVFHSYSILDATGKTIMQQPILTDKITINTMHLPPGIYCVKLDNDNGYITRKIVKM